MKKIKWSTVKKILQVLVTIELWWEQSPSRPVCSKMKGGHLCD